MFDAKHMQLVIILRHR